MKINENDPALIALGDQLQEMSEKSGVHTFVLFGPTKVEFRTKHAIEDLKKMLHDVADSL